MSIHSDQKKLGTNQEPKFCMFCGSPVEQPSAVICEVCGKPLRQNPPNSFPEFNEETGPLFTSEPYTSDFIRKCTSCGAEIRSKNLTDCPICNAPLPVIRVNASAIKYPAVVSLFMPVITYLFLMLVTFVAVILYIVLNPNFSIDSILNLVDSSEFLVIGLFLELAFILPPFLYLRQFFPAPSSKQRFELLGLPLSQSSWKVHATEVLIGLVIGGAMVFLVQGVQWLSEILWGAVFGPDFVTEAINSFEGTSGVAIPVNPLQLMLIWIGMFAAVGLSEEILYRGFTQRGLVQVWGKGAGILITALLFTLAHILPGIVPISTFVVFFLPYFAISLLLGGMREWRKGNLLACIIAHGFYNSLVITLVFLGW